MIEEDYDIKIEENKSVEFVDNIVNLEYLEKEEILNENNYNEELIQEMKNSDDLFISYDDSFDDSFDLPVSCDDDSFDDSDENKVNQVKTNVKGDKIMENERNENQVKTNVKGDKIMENERNENQVKADVKGDKIMENENKTVVNDFKDEKIENLRLEDEEMDLFFILDRSGSMYGSEQDTINGFNAFIEKQMVKNHNIRVTVILFDDEYKVLYSRIPIAEVKPLTSKDYYVRGCTALLDAIGKTVSCYEREVNRAMCVITTDGLENASREFSRDKIKNMIETCPWEFIYIGADIDSYGEASKIGIRHNRVANYKKSADGINDMYDAVDKATVHYCKVGNFDDEYCDWKEDLE